MLRLPPKPNSGDLIDAVQTLIGGLAREEIRENFGLSREAEFGFTRHCA